MKVILLKDVQGSGKKDDIVTVSPGHAVNFLLPRKLAVEATEANIRRVKNRKEQEKETEGEKMDDAKAMKKELEAGSITIKMKSGDKGRIFGSVTNQEIAAALKEQKNQHIDRKKIHLPDPIKELGKHQVEIKLFSTVSASITVLVEEE